MIDKNFYLENLSAFDILIKDERQKAEEVIFRVYCILQRDKIWLNEVATPEEIFEEDAELLEEVEEELSELDKEYNFNFDSFYKLMQQEMKKRAGGSGLEFNVEAESNVAFEDVEELPEDLDVNTQENDLDLTDDEDEDEDNFYEDEDDEDDEVFYEDMEEDPLSHLSDEDIDLVTNCILASAKTRFDFQQLLKSFPTAEEDFVEEHFLFPIIAGKAHEETNLEIAEQMHESFIAMDYQFEILDLVQMIEKKASELGKEILAFNIASDSLQQGANAQVVVQQISQLLIA